MSYVDRYWDETLVEFPFSPLRPEPEKVVIREVVREPEGKREEDTETIHPPCPLGREFDEWCHDNILLDKDMELLDVKRNIVLLTEQYRMYFKTANAACRNHTTPNYRCIHHILHEWMERLEKRERVLMPSETLFFKPREPEDESQTQDMTLGESLDKADDEEQNW